MKKIILPFAALLAIGLTSCEKCSDCSCDSTIVFEFEEGFDPGTKTVIENTYTNSFNQNYPEMDEEVCSKRRDHSSAVATFEDKSYSFTENSTSGGKEWSVDANRTCNCAD